VTYAPRPSATRAHRRRPYGLTAAEGARLVGLSPRTVQDWRASAAYVPLCPVGDSGHEQGSIYHLADLVALRVLADLRALGVTRDVAARVCEGVPLHPDATDDDDYMPYRQVAMLDPPWWYLLPVHWDLIDRHMRELPDIELIGVVPEDRVDAWVSAFDPGDVYVLHREEGFKRLSQADLPLIVLYPITALAAELAARADAWRRQRRIRQKDWMPWL